MIIENKELFNENQKAIQSIVGRVPLGSWVLLIEVYGSRANARYPGVIKRIAQRHKVTDAAVQFWLTQAKEDLRNVIEHGAVESHYINPMRKLERQLLGNPWAVNYLHSHPYFLRKLKPADKQQLIENNVLLSDEVFINLRQKYGARKRKITRLKKNYLVKKVGETSKDSAGMNAAHVKLLRLYSNDLDRHTYQLHVKTLAKQKHKRREKFRKRYDLEINSEIFSLLPQGEQHFIVDYLDLGGVWLAERTGMSQGRIRSGLASILRDLSSLQRGENIVVSDEAPQAAALRIIYGAKFFRDYMNNSYPKLHKDESADATVRILNGYYHEKKLELKNLEVIKSNDTKTFPHNKDRKPFTQGREVRNKYLRDKLGIAVDSIIFLRLPEGEQLFVKDFLEFGSSPLSIKLKVRTPAIRHRLYIVSIDYHRLMAGLEIEVTHTDIKNRAIRLVYGGELFREYTDKYYIDLHNEAESAQVKARLQGLYRVKCKQLRASDSELAVILARVPTIMDDQQPLTSSTKASIEFLRDKYDIDIANIIFSQLPEGEQLFVKDFLVFGSKALSEKLQVRTAAILHRLSLVSRDYRRIMADSEIDVSHTDIEEIAIRVVYGGEQFQEYIDKYYPEFHDKADSERVKDRLKVMYLNKRKQLCATDSGSKIDSKALPRGATLPSLAGSSRHHAHQTGVLPLR